MSDYLTKSQLALLKRLLTAFFSLPYSTDLDGKDAETLLKIAKGLEGSEKSKRKSIRLIRVHFKHNQIFTDHDIPKNAHRFDINVKRRGWEEIVRLLG